MSFAVNIQGKIMDVSFNIADYGRVLSDQIYNLNPILSDLVIVVNDGIVPSNKLPLFFAFPAIKQLLTRYIIKHFIIFSIWN